MRDDSAKVVRASHRKSSSVPQVQSGYLDACEWVVIEDIHLLGYTHEISIEVMSLSVVACIRASTSSLSIASSKSLPVQTFAHCSPQITSTNEHSPVIEKDSSDNDVWGFLNARHRERIPSNPGVFPIKHRVSAYTRTMLNCLTSDVKRLDLSEGDGMQ